MGKGESVAPATERFDAVRETKQLDGFTGRDVSSVIILDRDHIFLAKEVKRPEKSSQLGRLQRFDNVQQFIDKYKSETDCGHDSKYSQGFVQDRLSELQILRTRVRAIQTSPLCLQCIRMARSNIRTAAAPLHEGRQQERQQQRLHQAHDWTIDDSSGALGSCTHSRGIVVADSRSAMTSDAARTLQEAVRLRLKLRKIRVRVESCATQFAIKLGHELTATLAVSHVDKAEARINEIEDFLEQLRHEELELSTALGTKAVLTCSNCQHTTTTELHNSSTTAQQRTLSTADAVETTAATPKDVPVNNATAGIAGDPRLNAGTGSGCGASGDSIHFDGTGTTFTELSRNPCEVAVRGGNSTLGNSVPDDDVPLEDLKADIDTLSQGVMELATKMLSFKRYGQRLHNDHKRRQQGTDNDNSTLDRGSFAAAERSKLFKPSAKSGGTTSGGGVKDGDGGHDMLVDLVDGLKQSALSYKDIISKDNAKLKVSLVAHDNTLASTQTARSGVDKLYKKRNFGFLTEMIMLALSVVFFMLTFIFILSIRF